jgi:hypothetical protein
LTRGSGLVDLIDHPPRSSSASLPTDHTDERLKPGNVIGIFARSPNDASPREADQKAVDVPPTRMRYKGVRIVCICWIMDTEREIMGGSCTEREGLRRSIVTAYADVQV